MVREVMKEDLEDESHYLIVTIIDNKIVSSCVCVIIPDLTRNVRPYAFVENVVTHKDYRGKGYATECLNYAKDVAIKQNCYKMMLLTCRLLPFYVFLFAAGVEGLQYLELVSRLGLEDNTFLRILIGSVFDWMDILCYGIGCLVLGGYEIFLKK